MKFSLSSSETTRLLPIESSSSSLEEEINNESSTLSTTKSFQSARTWYFIGLSSLVAAVALLYHSSYSNNNTSQSTRPTTSEATMMQWMEHWDQWGKQQNQAQQNQQPYDLWGHGHSKDDDTTRTSTSSEEDEDSSLRPKDDDDNTSRSSSSSSSEESSSSSLRPKKQASSPSSTTDGDSNVPAPEDNHNNEPDRNKDATPTDNTNSNDNKKNTNNDTLHHHAEQWVHGTWKNASQEAQQWWHDTTTTSNNQPQPTQEWFHHAWNQTAQQAHDAWRHMQDRTDDPTLHVWWNQTMDNEQQWWNATLVHLHQLGTTLQSWWGQAEQQTKDQEQILGLQFQQWWQQANQVNREWWKETVHASQRLERVAERKTGLWWDATRAVTGKHWNYTVHEERLWWNATERWFHDHPLVDSTNGLPLLYLNSSQAYSMLMNGYGWYDYSSDFFLYQSGWDAQINQAYCGVASSAALLNSMRDLLSDSLPMDPNYDPHPYATQSILLSIECVNKNVVRYDDTMNGVLQFPGGLSLAQAQQLLQCHLESSTWNVSVVHVNVSDTTTDQVRRDLQSALKDPNARVLINYDRRGLGQDGGGHFSPLGSYSPQHDAFLIMDVAKYKYPPVWVPTARLVAAMGTIDLCGMWDFPRQQDRLADKDLLRPDSSRSYEKALKILGCEERFRGYLIVKLKERRSE